MTEPVKSEVAKVASSAKKTVYRDYVVVVDMISYRVEKGTSGVKRFLRGAKLRLDPTDARTKELRRSKAIAPASGDLTKTTIRVAAAAQGSPEDPAEPPKAEAEPLTPTNAEAIVPTA